MPWWSAERRNVPIARDVGRLESVQACVSARIRVPRKHPSAVSALRSPSLGREGSPHTTGAPGAAKQTGGGALASRDQIGCHESEAVRFGQRSDKFLKRRKLL